jgi:predicted ATPase
LASWRIFAEEKSFRRRKLKPGLSEQLGSRKQGAKSLELCATISLARLLRETDRREEARTMLGEIYDWFTEGFDTADLKGAKALLDELGGTGE